jgi:hypothetical protein
MDGSWTVDLVALYAPNSPTDRKFFTEIRANMPASPNLVVCRDFNSVFDPSMDRLSQALMGPRTTAFANLQKLYNVFNLQDVFRVFHPGIPGFTWSRSQPPVAARLDMFLVSSILMSGVADVSVRPVSFSDHSAVVLRLNRQDGASRGASYWKLNVSLLSNDSFCRRLRAFWLHWRYQKHRFSSILQWWDTGKGQLRSLCRHYGKTLQNRN